MHMLILGIVLLVISFIQAVLNLFVSTNNASLIRKKFTVFLSWSYVVGFIVGVLSLISQDYESGKLSSSVNNIVNNLNSLLSTVDTVNIALKRTQNIYIKIDSIDERALKLLNDREGLMAQYQKVNQQLNQQIELDKQLIAEKKPDVQILTDWIQWKAKSDSSTYYINFPITNLGRRAVKIMDVSGALLFYDESEKLGRSLRINKTTFEEPNLPPFDIAGNNIYISSPDITTDLDAFSEWLEFGIIAIKIKYIDELTNTAGSRHHYFAWDDKIKQFIFAQPWQVKWVDAWINLSGED